jgi:exopolysaccharide production repressor protein
MSFLPFFRGFLIALVAFGVSTYLMIGSLWSTLVQTAICGVLIQIGYFAAVVLMMQRSVGERPNPKKDRSVEHKQAVVEQVPAGQLCNARRRSGGVASAKTSLEGT